MVKCPVYRKKEQAENMIRKFLPFSLSKKIYFPMNFQLERVVNDSVKVSKVFSKFRQLFHPLPPILTFSLSAPPSSLPPSLPFSISSCSIHQGMQIQGGGKMLHTSKSFFVIFWGKRMNFISTNPTVYLLEVNLHIFLSVCRLVYPSVYLS